MMIKNVIFSYYKNFFGKNSKPLAGSTTEENSKPLAGSTTEVGQVP